MYQSLTVAALAFVLVANAFCEVPYRIVGTGQTRCYDDRSEIEPPRPDGPFFGQDAQFRGVQPAYKDNRDGTVSDINTGLTWLKARGEKVTFDAAVAGAADCRVGGHADWRMPTVKELYSLINFDGAFDPHGRSTPYIDTGFFDFEYGNETAGERPIDCQDWSGTEYVGTTMHGDATVFGVNFADGRIKGYPKFNRRLSEDHRLFVRYVRGNPDYGQNDFHDNEDGTISDRATGLMWSKADSGEGMNWEDALAWVQARNRERYLGHDDWRLPNAKELQSIVDYTRASPAIDRVFDISRLDDGEFPFFWSSTTHLDGPRDRRGTAAVYVAFGRATGWMRMPPGPRGQPRLLDVHGAGSQRSDPKTGDPSDFAYGRGPQGDVVRIFNHVRCVRGSDDGG